MDNPEFINEEDSKTGSGRNFFWFIPRGKYLLFLVLFIVILFLIFLFFSSSNSPEKQKQVCGDGTNYGECSLKKPYFCSNGSLIKKSSICECPLFFSEKNNSCISEYNKNPKKIILNYILDGNENQINFTAYQGMADYVSKISRSIDYKKGKVPSRVDFKLKSMNDKKQREFILPLVVKIQNITSDKDKQAEIAISIVQNIPYGFSNKTLKLSGKSSVIYSRYPYEVLYDFEGICGEKSQLLAFLLKELGFQTAIFYNQEENHESVGIKCPMEKSWDKSGYCFVETSGPSIISDTSITYVGGTKLESKPKVMVISEGISLSKGLQEYQDAEALGKINKKIEETGEINYFDNRKLKELQKKFVQGLM